LLVDFSTVFMMNFLSSKLIFLISDQGNMILGVSLLSLSYIFSPGKEAKRNSVKNGIKVYV
jgi:hypothetical protein